MDAVGDTVERRVSVRISGHPDQLVVEVDDSGPGVPEEDSERVLERGWSTKASGGRGIGLALVAQVARRHGGSVRVDASPLGGARLTVTLDRVPEPRP
jgi:two-component system CitB family sensor kinase